jgi:hypothetical protein
MRRSGSRSRHPSPPAERALRLAWIGLGLLGLFLYLALGWLTLPSLFRGMP